MDGLVSRRQLSLDLGLTLLARVREEAEARDLSLAVAVVDPAGNVPPASGWTARLSA